METTTVICRPTRPITDDHATEESSREDRARAANQLTVNAMMCAASTRAYAGTSSRSTGHTQKIVRASQRNKAVVAAASTSLSSAFSAQRAPSAAPTAKCAAPNTAPDDVALIKACRAKGIAQKDAAALLGFIKDHGVASAGVVDAMNNAKGNALEAAKAYAIIDDAVRTKLNPTNAARMRTVAQALRDGRVTMETRDDSKASASYDRDSNTMTLPASGIALGNIAAQTLVIHESTHVAQDAARLVQNRYDAERDAYDVSADYNLRATGALRDGKLDFAAAQLDDLTQQSFDVAARARIMFAKAQENVRIGNAHCNGEFRNATADELAHMAPRDDFEEHYANVQRASGVSEEEIAAMKIEHLKDGL